MTTFRGYRGYLETTDTTNKLFIAFFRVLLPGVTDRVEMSGATIEMED